MVMKMFFLLCVVKKREKKVLFDSFTAHTTINKLNKIHRSTEGSLVFFLLWPFYLHFIFKFDILKSFLFFFFFSLNFLIVEVVHVYKLLLEQTWRWYLALRSIFALPQILFLFIFTEKESCCRSQRDSQSSVLRS